jgi:amidohydrolase
MINIIKKNVDDIYDEIVSIRRHLHKYPELSFNEYKTSLFIKKILTDWKIPFVENIADTGVVVVIEGQNPAKKTTGLRADFDALPILEENNIEYCSQNEGVMHACGHDAHTAILLGVLKILNFLKDKWTGTVKFIFQPAEEQFPGGANQMIKEGVLENPHVEKMFGQHVFPELESGKVGFCPGRYMASADEIEISIIGKGGHAALPNTYNNPIIAASKLVLALDEYFLPFSDIPAVFAIGFFNADGFCNVIPDKVDLKGTFRTIDENFRDSAHERMVEISNSISEECNVSIDFVIRKGYPSLYNDENLTFSAIKHAKDFLGKENVIDLSLRMTAEDFAYFGQKVPSCFYRLGSSNIKRGIIHGLHTSKFDIDEKSLKIGIGLMSYLAIKN